MLSRTYRLNLRQAIGSARGAAACTWSRRPQSSLPKFDASRTFQLTQSPSPEWDLGQGISPASPLAKEWNEAEKLGWKSCTLSDMPGRYLTEGLSNLS
ncbi:uncharacterized protein PHACADRAFT_162499 [Phanerochaete carnosa HHB-10118-sp]|uniref:Uncharacterized protein n=1 Tax=Phanerochaete carnosa (strain HHB-10118-sp) TaxID=650164 RepID=K5WUJ0_PHACS|nr:uncharacterized protein PHACADRAFT_162499 [Phanerochaete carnosa HHB-10118-sp]EKM54127.1 hypothetical protein PHACADRAFT_162499 [Phanerochaete carnosa HHB-10118-sp]